MKLIPSTRLGVAAASVASIAALTVAGVGGYALAAGSLPGQVGSLSGCIIPGQGITGARGIPANLRSCPAGAVPFSVTSGQQGPAGKNGTNGIISSTTTTVVSADTSVPAGGSFNANAVDLGTVSLPEAGTYLLTFNAKVKGNDTSTTADIFPQFFVYDQVKNPDFSGDLFNIGDGPIEPATTNHDSYFSGTEQVKVDGATTLHIYGFGYLSNQGAGTYDAENVTLTATELQTAGS
ncbi:MAG TPA: hypothetical protein VF070_26730 [Streptosporangiaceae bacterium]